MEKVLFPTMKELRELLNSNDKYEVHLVDVNEEDIEDILRNYTKEEILRELTPLCYEEFDKNKENVIFVPFEWDDFTTCDKCWYEHNLLSLDDPDF